jgi:hypothetical protein
MQQCRATQLSVEVSLLGGYGIGTSIVFVPLAAFPEVSFPTTATVLTRYLAVAYRPSRR